MQEMVVASRHCLQGRQHTGSLLTNGTHIYNPPNRIHTHQSIQNPHGKNKKVEELQDLLLAEGVEKASLSAALRALENASKGAAAGKREPPPERGSRRRCLEEGAAGGGGKSTPQPSSG